VGDAYGLLPFSGPRFSGKQHGTSAWDSGWCNHEH
jgi:hypothetical protein